MSKSRFKKGQIVYRVETFSTTSTRHTIIYKVSVVKYTVDSCGLKMLTLAEDNTSDVYGKKFKPFQPAVSQFFVDGHVATAQSENDNGDNLMFHSDQDSALKAAQWVINNAQGTHPGGITFIYEF